MDATAITVAVSSFVTAVIGIIIAAMTARSAATKAELESLRDTIRLQREEIDRYASRTEKLENSRDDLWKDNEELRECIVKMEDENKELSSSIQSIRAARAAAEAERDALRTQMAEMKNQSIPALEEKIARLKKMIVDLGGKPPTGPLTGQ